MVCYRGIIVVFCVSICCAPMTGLFLSHQIMSQKLPMYCAEYSMFLTALGIFLFFLPPDCDFWNFERRGIFYYVCGLLCCIAVVELTLEIRRFVVVGTEKHSRFFDNDEMYLKTPFGMSTIIWNDVVNYIIYLFIIFLIDNCSSIRNVALYWCGATMTSEFVIGISLLSGPDSNRVQYSSLVDILYVCISCWVLNHFFMCHCRYVCKGIECRRSITADVLLVLAILFSMLFTFTRSLGVLNSNQYYVKLYVTRYEPYILHRSKFGAVWVLITAVYGIPCQILSLYHLYCSTCRKGLDMALMHAGSMLQGTFVYLSYNWYPSSEKQYRVPPNSFPIVMGLNIFVVLVAHFFLLRCFWTLPYHYRPVLCSYKDCSDDDCCDDDDDCLYDDDCCYDNDCCNDDDDDDCCENNYGCCDSESDPDIPVCEDYHCDPCDYGCFKRRRRKRRMNCC